MLDAPPDLFARWGIEVERRLPGGLNSTVVLGRMRTGPVVVKVPRRAEDARDERITLRAWNGRGAVELLDADEATGALLLRYVPGRALIESDLDAAVAMLAELHAVAAEGVALPTTLERHERWLETVPERRGAPVTRADRARADRLAHELWADVRRPRVLHGDLNPLNVLVEGGRAVAIDPGGMLGEPATDAANLAITLSDEPDAVSDRVRRLARLTGHDVERVEAYAYVFSVMSSLFRFGVGRPASPARLAYVASARSSRDP